jgi:hypothetical protein
LKAEQEQRTPRPEYLVVKPLLKHIPKLVSELDAIVRELGRMWPTDRTAATSSKSGDPRSLVHRIERALTSTDKLRSRIGRTQMRR